MSLFERAQQAPPTVVPALTVQDAAAGILAGAMAADGSLGPEEIMRLTSLLGTMRLYQHDTGAEREERVGRAVDLITRYGLPAVVTTCADTLPADLRPTVFALATDLVLADGYAGDEEREFIDDLQGLLGVEDELALKIVEVMIIKNKG